MSWQNRYLLPWDHLDLDKIEDGVAHVMASGLPLHSYEIVVQSPNSVRVYFRFAAGLERKWDLLSAVERNFKLYGIVDTDMGLVDIGFDHTPADPKLGLPAGTAFEFYSNISGNSVFSGVGVEIAMRLGRFYGTTCEPV